MSNVREESISGVKWQLISRMTLQPVAFIFGIILARLISPAEMGILGLTSIFFVIAYQLKDCGFGIALIRKVDRTDADINTVFWFNVVMSLVACAGLCLAAPWFADFFNTPPLVELTYVSAVMLFLNSTATVHWTLFSARRDFKTIAMISTVTTIIPMPLCVWAAFSGWSYWSIMLQGVLSGLLSLIIIWIKSPWKPRFQFSIESFREFFGFGSKLFLSNLLSGLYRESRGLIIGKFYSPADLALFNRAYKMVELPSSIVQGTVSSISLPILSAIQHDEARFIATYRKYFRLTLLVVFWFLITVSANSQSIVYTLYGEAWMKSVIYVYILSFCVINTPIVSIMESLILVKGRSDIVLRTMIIVRVSGVILLAVSAFYGIVYICVAAVIAGMMHFMIYLLCIAREGWISYKTQINDTYPYLLIALIVNIPALVINLLFEPHFTTMIVGGSLSLIMFLVIMHFRNDAAWAIILDILEEKGILKYLPFLRKPTSESRHDWTSR